MPFKEETKMVRYAQHADLPAIRRMAEETYHDTDAYNDFYFSLLWQPERTGVNERDGQVVAAGQIVDLDIAWQGKVYPSGLLYAATTDNAWKKQGLVKEIAAFLHEDLKQKGCSHVVAFINLKATKPWQSIGFTPAFPLCFRTVQYEQTADVNISPLNLADMHLIPQLNALYEKEFGQYAHVVRTGALWQMILMEYAVCGGGTYLLWEDGQLAGYCVYEHEDDQLHLKECVANTPEMKKALSMRVMQEQGAQSAVCWECATPDNMQDCVASGIIQRIAPDGMPDIPYEMGYMNLIHI